MKLTKAQIRALEAANRSGGVVGFGRKWRTITILKTLGMLTANRDNYGYYNITPAGRQALATSNGGER